MLQGLCRVEIRSIVREKPYRVVSIKPLLSNSAAAGTDLNFKRTQLNKLLALKYKALFQSDKAIVKYLQSIDDPETFLDIAAHTLCDSADLKQKLLETLDIAERYELYSERLRMDVAMLKLENKIKGDTSIDKISDN